MRPPVALILGTVLQFVGAFPAPASTIRSDVSDSYYTTLASQSAYSGVGMVKEYISSTSSYAGSGTLLSSQWVLTAAHMVTSADNASDLTFTINNVVYTADSYTAYSSYNSNTLSGDLALVHLSTAVTNVTYATLYSGTTADLLSLTATYVGYGCTGTGQTGYDSTTYGTKRAVENVLDALGSSVYSNWSSTDLVCDFDSPSAGGWGHPGGSVNRTGSATPLDLEGLIAPGDSGGGAFVTIDGTTYLAGVISFLGYADGKSDASYGDYGGIVSIADYETWIYGTTVTTLMAPEPVTLGLVGVGAVVFGIRRAALGRKSRNKS